MGTSLVWFRHDLRLDDHAALHAATQHGGAVVPVFIWAPEEEGRWPPGAASRWWLHHSLGRLGESLQRVGSRLILRRGLSVEVLSQLVEEIGATALYFQRRDEPAAAARDQMVIARLALRLTRIGACGGALLFEPGRIRTRQGEPFQVFTPFWRACLARDDVPAPLPAVGKLPAPAQWPHSEPLDALGLLPAVDWADGIRAAWQPGEATARGELRAFIEHRLVHYDSARERPDLDGTSRLSPYLHFGEISPRRVWHEVQAARRAASIGDRPAAQAMQRAAEGFLRQLGWREFAHHLLMHFPHTPNEPLRPEFAEFPWDDHREHLRAWQRGQTGYPLVDAGMRQLWRTGWMHNRVRMIAASFLVKDLMLPWHAGAAWFWDTLVDADLANNTLGWQWAAGCGADAAPFFRVFNPVSQGTKFDPNGDYIRRFVPELSRLEAPWIHRPWTAPDEVLAAANVKLGKTYLSPIVDHAAARRRALAAWQHLKHRQRR
jgi:deoxyribodipyrimidine photo-lyase